MNGIPPNGKVVAQSSGNWIAVSRDSRDHPIVGCGQLVPPADPKRGSWSRYEAWQDLCMEAAWKPAKATTRGRQVVIDRGQILAALPVLAARWNWSVGTVRWFLKTLEEDGMVAKVEGGKEATKDAQQQAKRQATSNASRVLTICNYDKYQMRMDLEHLLNNRQSDRQPPIEAFQGENRQAYGPSQQAKNEQQQSTQQANPRENSKDVNDIGDTETRLTTGNTTTTGNAAGKQQATQQAQQQAIEPENITEINDIARGEAAPTTGITAGNDSGQQQASQHAYKEEQLNKKQKEKKGRSEISPSAKIPNTPGLAGQQVRRPALLLGELAEEIPPAAEHQSAAPDEVAMALDAYNASAARAGWPKAVKLTAQRKAHIKARLVDAGGLDGWAQAMSRAEKSSFLCGASKSNWTASLDFMLQASSFMKLIEGTYDNKKPVIWGNNYSSASTMDEDGSFVGI